MAEKKVKVTLDINSNIAPTIANLRALKLQLKEAEAGTQDYINTAKKIKDVEDALEEAKVGAKGFVDQLEEAPGPIGAIAQGFRKVEIATKSFGAAFKAAGIGLIVSLIGGLAAALSKSEETMKKFEPIVIMFEQTLNGLLGALQPLIDGFIQLALNVMPYVTQAFKVVYSSVTAVFQSLGKLGGAVVKLFKGDFKGAWEDAKASVTSFDDNYQAAVVRFEAGQKKMTKTQKENLDKQQKDRDEAEKEREKREEEAFKVQLEAYRSRLDDRNKELLAAEDAYEERRKTLIRAGITDFTAIDEQFRIEKQKINDKYDKEEKDKADKKREDELKRAEESAKFYLEQYNQIKEYQDSVAENTFKSNQAIAQSWVDLGQNIAGVFGTLINVFEEGSTAAKAFGIAQVAINAASSIGQILTNSKAAGFEYDKAIAKGNATIIQGGLNAVIPGFQVLAAAQLAAGKAAVGAAVAGKVALKANTAAQIGAVGVSSAAQIAAILSAKKSTSTATGATAVGSTGGGTISIAAPTIGGTAAPQIQAGTVESPTAQIGQTLAAAQKPIRAYILSSEVSSQQALDRRTSRAATFSGG